MNKTTNVTDELFNELKFNKQSLDDFIRTHEDAFINYDLKAFWKDLVEKSGMSKSDIINKSEYSYVYFYDVISGKKYPTSDKIVRLILAMKLGIEDCQRAMDLCGRSKLYPRIKRDAIIIYAIENQLSVQQLQEQLQEAGEKLLK